MESLTGRTEETKHYKFAIFIGQVGKLTQGVKQQEHNTENPHDAKRFQKGFEKKKRKAKISK